MGLTPIPQTKNTLQKILLLTLILTNWSYQDQTRLPLRSMLKQTIQQDRDQTQLPLEIVDKNTTYEINVKGSISH